MNHKFNFMNHKFLYVGPSWARLSYDTKYGDEKTSTNLLKLWKLTNNAVDLSKKGAGPKGVLKLLQVYNKWRGNVNRNNNKEQKLNLPIIYVACEPLKDMEKVEKVDKKNKHRKNYKVDHNYDYIAHEKDIMKFRKQLLKSVYKKLNLLGVRIGIIGGHTDCENEENIYENITVLDRSWQNFLAREAGISERKYNWGAEVFHRHIRHSSNNPIDRQTVIDVDNQFKFWRELEDAKLMCWCHPTTLANKLYAEYTYNKVIDFIKEY